MESIIPGTYVTPPPQNSTIVIKPHNFGYCILAYPNKSSRVKFEFMGLTACREILNNSRIFINRAFNVSLDSYLKFDYDQKPFFYAPDLPIELVALIFENIENRIGLKTRAKFQMTDVSYESNLIAIYPGRFWGGVAPRFGLFTCLLRAVCRLISQEGYKNTPWIPSLDKWIDRSIDSDEYLYDTKSSVLNFMSGKTFFVPINHTADWHAHMKGGYGDKFLVDPTKFTHDQYINYVKKYAETVWNIFSKVSGRDEDIWNAAERYAAMNACR